LRTVGSGSDIGGGPIDFLSYLANTRSRTDDSAGPDAGEFSVLKRKILTTVASLLVAVIAIVVIAVVAT